jgi:hypothetical protein
MAMELIRPAKVGTRTGRRVIGNLSDKINNTNTAAKNQANTGCKATFDSQTIQEIIGRAALVSGFGQHHTAHPDKENPRTYVTITLEQIMAMAENPSSVAKDKAQWMIPSTTGGAEARGHAFQREHGVFRALWEDLDDVQGLTFQEVVERIKRAIPDVQALVYTTRSATPDNPKCRAIIPLAEGIPGADYPMMAKILNDRLKAAGLIPDRATERTGQLCYLANRGEFYQYHYIEGETLSPASHFAEEIQAETERLKAEAAEREARHREALRKTQARIDTGQADPIAAYRETYPVKTALERYGHTRQQDRKWLPPGSESGKAGGTVKDGKVHFFNGCMSGFGRPSKGGGTWGDGFDLFTFHEHGGNFNRAVQAAGEMFYRTDPETGERITITLFNQRQHMRGQDTGADPGTDFQGTGNQGDQTGGNKPDPWEPIIPLDAMEVDRIDPETLPGIIGEYAEAVARETETPLELAAGMLFVVIAACVQGFIKIMVKLGYSEPLAYWNWALMLPATRKSQVAKRSTAPLTEWERRQRANLEPFIQARRIDRENIQARIKALRTRYGKAKPDELEAIGDEIKDLENSLEPELVSPQIWAQDCTPENAGQIMARNNERLAFLGAEGGIVDTLGGRYSGGTANLDLFLQGYSCEPVKVNRTTRDDIFLNTPALSMGLMPQPDVLRGMAAKPEFKGRGFIGRPMYWLPESNLGSRTLDSEPIPERLKTAYYQTIEKLLEIRPIEHPDGTTEPHTLTLSGEAFREWKDFYMTIEHDLADGGRFEHCRDWAGKTPGRAARLAGLLHCAMNPVEPWRYPVTLETMEQALDITMVSCTHALAVFNLMGADPAIESAGRVLKWIKRHRYQTFTKKMAFDALRGTFTRAAMLDEPLKVLAERNYIRAIEPEKGPGRPPEPFGVNPAVLWGE